jgi:hypothetical protein
LLILWAAVLATYAPTAFSDSLESEAIQELVPGDPRIDGSLIPQHVARWRLSRVAPDGAETELGLWMDRHEIVERDGRRLIRFQTDVLRHGEDPRRDLIFRDLETLAPVSVELENYNRKGGWAYLHYDGPRYTVVFRRGPQEETQSSHHVMERRFFGPGQGAMLVLFLEPKVGDAFRYPAHNRVADTVEMVTVRITGKDSYTSPEGTQEVLLVENSLGWKSWWIAEPPYVLRLEIPSKTGGTDRWELLDCETQP